MKKRIIRALLAVAVGLALVAVTAPQAKAIHSSAWAAQTACSQLELPAAVTIQVWEAWGTYGGCGLDRYAWSPPGYPNRHYMLLYYYVQGGCTVHNPWALTQWVAMTDGGTVTYYDQTYGRSYCF